MANLLRPLRFIGALRQASNNMAMLGAVQQRLKSDVPVKSDDSLNTPLAKKPVDPTFDPKESYLADPWEILYGAERFEIAMKAKGFDDPYDMEAQKRKAVSTMADPNIVTTLDNSRVVACICEPDTHHITYLWISKGETKRCECGHWFKCVERKLPDLTDYGLNMIKEAHH